MELQAERYSWLFEELLLKPVKKTGSHIDVPEIFPETAEAVATYEKILKIGLDSLNVRR